MKRSGQSVAEFIVMLGLLTVIGIWITLALVGPKDNPSAGAIAQMQVHGAQKIAQEKD